MEERTVIAPEPAAGAPAGAEATRVIAGPAAGYEATQQAVVAPCPVCGTPNPPAERFCQDCGFMFGSAPGEIEPLPDLSQLPRLLDPSGREFPLDPGLQRVGRENAEILLLDPTVSRRHAQLTLEEGRLVVEDLGSTNGTFVSGRPVRPGERAVAYDGDTLKFGSVALTLAIPGGAARPADAGAASPEAAAAVADRGEPRGFVRLPDGTEFPLYEGTNTLGRRSTNQIPIPDAFASGRHAEIRIAADGTAEFVDLGSTNGSYIAGERLAPNVPVRLEDGMEVTLGKTTIAFHAASPGFASADDAAAAPAAAEQPE